MLKFVIFDENDDICCHEGVIWVSRILETVELLRGQGRGRKMNVFEGTRHHGSIVKSMQAGCDVVIYEQYLCAIILSL